MIYHHLSINQCFENSYDKAQSHEIVLMINPPIAISNEQTKKPYVDDYQTNIDISQCV